MFISKNRKSLYKSDAVPFIHITHPSFICICKKFLRIGRELCSVYTVRHFTGPCRGIDLRCDTVTSKDAFRINREIHPIIFKIRFTGMVHDSLGDIPDAPILDIRIMIQKDLPHFNPAGFPVNCHLANELKLGGFILFDWTRDPDKNGIRRVDYNFTGICCIIQNRRRRPAPPAWSILW